MAGARGGVHASSDEKAKAARALRGYYSQMNEKPPPSLAAHSNVIEFIEHHGVKGMKWGKRRARSASPSSGPPPGKKKFTKDPSRLSDAELKKRISRLEMEKRYTDLNTAPAEQKKIGIGQKFVSRLMKTAGDATFGAMQQVMTNQLAGQMNKQIAKSLAKKSAGTLLKDIPKGGFT